MASIVMQDYGNASLDDETLTIVEYVEKLTKDPSEMTEEDIETPVSYTHQTLPTKRIV